MQNYQDNLQFTLTVLVLTNLKWENKKFDIDKNEQNQNVYEI
jgi:hypothetical protein